MSIYHNSGVSFLQTMVGKRERKTISIGTKMLVIKRMEAGETRASVCRALDLAPATVSTIMANAKKIKKSAQKTAKLSTSNVSYTRSYTMEKMEQLLTLWVDDLIRKRIPLTQRIVSTKAKSLFDNIQQKEGGHESFTASKGWFARFKERSRIRNIKINGEAASEFIEAACEFPNQMQCYAQPLSNEELEELAHNLNEHDEDSEDEGEECIVETIQTTDLQDILATIDSATQRLCEIDPDLERTSKVKRSINSILHPYYMLLQEKQKREQMQPGPSKQ